jgi:hypothetical protein
MASIKLKGDTSGEVTISAPSVAGTTTLELPATSSTLATQNSLGVRNLIINGDMRVAQRGTSSTGITGLKYLVDRFFLNVTTAGTWTYSQDTDVPTGQGFSNSAKLSCTTADASLGTTDLVEFFQVFEGQNVQHIKKGTANAEKLTLSFWVKSNKTGNFNANLIDNDNTRFTGKQITISLADTWEKKTVTFPADTTGTLDNDNNGSFRVFFTFAAGSTYSSGNTNQAWTNDTTTHRGAGVFNLADSTSNYINITGVQLEVGTEATPFEHRPYDMELARCQRYFNLQFTYVLGGGVYTQYSYPSKMRTAPTITGFGAGGFVGASSDGFALFQQTSGGTQNMTYSAEL